MAKQLPRLSSGIATLFVAFVSLLATTPVTAQTNSKKVVPLTPQGEIAFHSCSTNGAGINLASSDQRVAKGSIFTNAERPANLETRAEGEQYKVSFNVKKPSDENIQPFRIMLIYPEWGLDMAYLDFTPYHHYDTPILAEGTVWDGTYPVLGIAAKLDGDNTICNIFYCTEATVNGADIVVDIDFDQCVHKLSLSALMGNGEPFPLDPDCKPYDKHAVCSSASFSMYGCGGYQEIYGSTDVYVLVNDAPADAVFSSSFDYYDWTNMTGSRASGGVDGPFTEDFSGVIPQDSYQRLTNKSSMTETDLSLGVRTACFGYDKLYAVYQGDMYSVENHDTLWMSLLFESSECADEMECYITTGQSHIEDSILWESAAYTGFAAEFFNNESWMSCHKCSAPQIMVGDDYILTSWFPGPIDGVFTLTSPAEIYNINPKEQDIVNFLQPLYCVIDGYWNTFDGETLGYASIESMNFYGPMHERLSFPLYNYDYLTLSVNGEPKTLDDLAGLPWEGLEIKGECVYPDGLVDNKYPCKYQTNFTVVTKDRSDTRLPSITGYQVRTGEGKITPHTSLDDKEAMFYCSGLDQLNNGTYTNPTIEVYVSKGGLSQDWTLVETKQEVVGGNTGTLCSFNISEYYCPLNHKVPLPTC